MSDAVADTLGRGIEKYPDLAGAYKAMLLGKKNAMSKEDRNMFSVAGTVHVFAISGLHVGIMAGLIGGMAQLFFPGERGRVLLVLPCVVAFVWLTGLRASAVRAAWMYAFYAMGIALRRRRNLLCAWSSTVLVVYGFRPERIYDTGCALSFVVMLGIAAWIIASRRLRLEAVEDVAVTGVTFSAWAAGAPLVGRMFGFLPCGGLVANPLVIALADRVVRLGVLSIIFGFVFRPLSVIVNTCAVFCLFCMQTVSRLVSRLSFLCIQTGKWNLCACLLWYAVYAGILYCVWRFRPSGPVIGVWWKKSETMKAERI